MERLKELQEVSVESDEKDIETEDYVEKIQEVLELKYGNHEKDQVLNEVEDQLAKAIPMEILLEMVEDPEVSEPILEIAMDRLKELEDEESDKEDIESKNPSQIQLEVILDMAKDPEVGEPILEMAMEKIKNILEEKEDGSVSKQVSSEASDSLPKALPMQILLEMAKDPEAKEYILKLAMKRLKELQELYMESDMELVPLVPKRVEGEHVAATAKNPEEPVILQFPRFF